MCMCCAVDWCWTFLWSVCLPIHPNGNQCVSVYFALNQQKHITYCRLLDLKVAERAFSCVCVFAVCMVGAVTVFLFLRLFVVVSLNRLNFDANPLYIECPLLHTSC